MAGENEIGIRVVILGVNEARRQLNTTQNSINRLEGVIRRVSQSTARFGQSISALGNAIGAIGSALTFGLTLPLAAASAGALAAGITFETAFAGVSKTVDGVADDFGNLTELGQRLRQEFRNLAVEIPIPINELARIGEISGQLGVAEDDLIEFTEIIGKVGATTELTTDRAAFAFARLANILGEDDNLIPFTRGLANAIVDLGNNAAATEPEITEMALRLAGAGRVVGLSTQEILGFSAALAEMGIRAELGGTALSRVLQEAFLSLGDTSTVAAQKVGPLADAVDSVARELNRTQVQIFETQSAMAVLGDEFSQGPGQLASLEGKAGDLTQQLAFLEGQLDADGQAFVQAQSELATFAAIAGLSADEFRQAFKEDAAGATITFIERLAELQDAGQISKETLTELGLSGVRVRDVLNRLGGNMDIVRENIDRANRAWEEQEALQIEFNKRAVTVASRLQVLKNQFADLGISIFDLVRDDLVRLIEGLGNIIDFVKNLDPGLQRLILSFAGFAAALGPTLLILGRIVSIIGLGITAFGALLTPVGALAAAFGTLAGALVLPTIRLDGILGKIDDLVPGAETAARNIIGAFQNIAHNILNSLPTAASIAERLSSVTSRLSGLIAPIIIPIKIPPIIPADLQPTIDLLKQQFQDLFTAPTITAPSVGQFPFLPEDIGPVTTALGQEVPFEDRLIAFSETLSQVLISVFNNLKVRVLPALIDIAEEFGLEMQRRLQAAFSPENLTQIALDLGISPEQIAAVTTGFIVLKNAISIFIEDTKGSFDELHAAFSELGIELPSLGDTIAAFIFGLAFVVSVAIGFLSGVVRGITTFITNLLGGFQLIQAGVRNAVTGIQIILGNAMLLIRSFLEGNFELARQAIIGILDGALFFAGGLLTAIFGLFSATFLNIAMTIRGYIEQVIGFFQTLYDRLVGNSIIPELVDKIFDSFSTLGVKILTSVSTFITKLIDKFQGLRDTIGNIFDTIKNTMIGKIEEGIASVLSFITNLYNQLVGHSILPDLAIETDEIFSSIASHMVNTTAQMVDQTLAQFSRLSSLTSAGLSSRAGAGITTISNVSTSNRSTSIDRSVSIGDISAGSTDTQELGEFLLNRLRIAQSLS